MMKVCVTCGSLVRHWIDKKTGEIHFQCVGCRKKWTEAGRDGQSQDQRFDAQDADREVIRNVNISKD